MESIAEAVVVANLQGEVLMINRAALALLGRESPEQLDVPLSEFEKEFALFDLNGQEVPPQARPLARALREQYVDYELKVVNRRTSRCWVGTFNGVTVYDKTGEAILVVVTVRDITERKHLDQELRSVKEQLQTITENMSIGVVQCNRERRLIWSSVAYAHWIGRDPAELVGQPLVEVLGEEAYRLIEPYIDHVLTGERTEYELRLNMKDIGERWVTGKYIPTFDAAGQPDGWVAVVYDITDQKRIAEELKQSRDHLEQRVAERTAELSWALSTLRVEAQQRSRAEEELRDKEQMLIQQSRMAVMGEMIANIAHQWRQPLNVLGLLAQDLEFSYKANSLTAEYIEMSVAKILDSIRHMSKTIDDFRNFFKPGKERVQFKIQEPVRRALSILEGTLTAQRIEVSVVAGSDPVLSGYPSEMAQAIINIIANARDALVERQVPDPRITIELPEEEGKGLVVITDNAGGIPEDIIDEVFAPYFTTKPEGTGLGLYISKVIIESMDGSLTVRNVDGGTEFRITLSR
ncbi:PAS domain-containing protein [Geomonas sp. Red421]|uniref:histidine kinase n=2 Tax=Geomonas anaerohicana TaxID=2798583 RepID=A0ABS0YHT9_9BACT|nr:PAS domain-containing protein [Geomonas anaerohicana]